MKPLNLDNRPCSPISSNCVIWQGPDIPCIKLCTGDTVSDVVYKLGTELCTIMDELKVSNYDLSCLGINACPPADFKALIQLLIDKICEANGITTDTPKSAGCPDCVVSVAPCFVEGTTTTMQLVDYVNAIANKVCSILSEIQVINDSINNLVNITNDLQYQIDNLPVYELPKITLTSCSIGPYAIGTQVSLDTLVGVFINTVWCPFYSATGTTSELLSAVAKKCITDGTLQLSTGTAYGLNPNWIIDANYNTVADAINNIWVVLCDVFNYVKNGGITVQDTTTVNLTYASGTLSAAVQDTGWHCLAGFDHYSTDPTMLVKKPQVRRIGNVLHFRGAVVIPLGAGTPLTWLYKGGQNTYQGATTETSQGTNKIAPYTGAGGVTILSGQSIAFNKEVNCIPTAVLPAGISIDGTYSVGWRMAWRSMDTGTYSTILSSRTNLAITSGGVLIWGTLRDLEESISISGASAYSTSHFNYTVSNVKGLVGETPGDRVPEFSDPLTTIYDNSASGQQALSVNFSTTERYPLTINANDPNQIGGFWAILDGLTAFIGPCEDTIPTPTLDANACAGTCA